MPTTKTPEKKPTQTTGTAEKAKVAALERERVEQIILKMR
jgi:hypothetical protein